MKKYHITISLILITLSSFSQISEAEFGEILNNAVKKIGPTNYEMTNLSGFKPIEYVRKKGSNNWEIGLNSWGPSKSEYSQDLLKTVAIITLSDEGYTLVSATQAVDGDVLESVKDYKYVKVARKWLVKQMNFANVTFDWVDGKHVTMASSPLDGKASKISDDLMNIINVSRGFQNTVAMGVKKSN